MVDDEPYTLNICKRILKEYYGVKIVHSGVEAIQIAHQERFDLLLTDIKMPGIDGLETAREIKKIIPDIICVTMTGFSTMEIAIEALRQGIDEFVVKPFSPIELTLAVEKALNRRDKVNEIIQLKRQLSDLHYKLQEERERNAKISDSQFPFTDLNHLHADVVHDIRNGLGVIRNTTGFLEDDLCDKYELNIQKIYRSLDFCELVLRNLLTLGGQDVLQLKRVNLGTIVQEIFFILDRKLVDVDLVMAIDPYLPEIMADEGQMKQVFLNLIKNAGEAMLDGGTFTCRMWRENELLAIKLSDTGCGISPENQQKLFKEFFTTKKYGYGLGLRIVDTIIKRHQGTITVESSVDEGTTFILRLPIEISKG